MHFSSSLRMAGLDQNMKFTQLVTTQDMHFSISAHIKAGLDQNVNFTQLVTTWVMGHALQYPSTHIMAVWTKELPGNL